MKKIGVFSALVLLLLPSLVLAQKIGILPFEDATGTGAEIGEQVAKLIRSEFLKDQRITPKFIQYKPKDEEESSTVDLEKAIELGKKNGVEYVLIGTILEAEATSSASGIGGISVAGQSLGSSLRTVKATITIQGDLISVKQAKQIGSYRTTGNRTERSVGADVSTSWGSLNTDRNADYNSPNAKALREAVEKLVKEVSAKLTPEGKNGL
jgi:curli biogenesis system outer membrane secretion channel CsgG